MKVREGKRRGEKVVVMKILKRKESRGEKEREDNMTEVI